MNYIILSNLPLQFTQFIHYPLLPLVFYHFDCATACNETHGIAVGILSVRLSVCPSGVCIVTKLNDALRIF